MDTGEGFSDLVLPQGHWWSQARARGSRYTATHLGMHAIGDAALGHNRAMQHEEGHKGEGEPQGSAGEHNSMGRGRLRHAAMLTAVALYPSGCP